LWLDHIDDRTRNRVRSLGVFGHNEGTREHETHTGLSGVLADSNRPRNTVIREVETAGANEHSHITTRKMYRTKTGGKPARWNHPGTNTRRNHLTGRKRHTAETEDYKPHTSNRHESPNRYEPIQVSRETQPSVHS